MLDFQVIISSTSPTSLPVGKPVALFEILSGYVELSQPATNKDIENIISASSDEATISSLQGLKVSYDDEVIAKTAQRARYSREVSIGVSFPWGLSSHASAYARASVLNILLSPLEPTACHADRECH